MKVNLIKGIVKYIITGLILLTAVTGIVYADNENGNSGKVNVNPGSIHFDIEKPVSKVPGNKVLTLERKKDDKDADVFYQVIDNSGSPIDLAKYIMARTPYTYSYQTLDKPVKFLDEKDNYTNISLKFKIDELFWANVPNGVYHLDLVSTRGKSVNILVKVKKVSYMTIYPDTINIFADKGPGTYESQENATVYINNMNNRWNLDIGATPLLYQGKNEDNSSDLDKSDIYVAVDNSGTFISLKNTYRLNGRNYGNTAAVDLSFRVKVRDKHLAGDYQGQVILTISAD